MTSISFDTGNNLHVHSCIYDNLELYFFCSRFVGWIFFISLWFSISSKVKTGSRV